MSDTSNVPPIPPTITIHQLQRDDNDVVVYDDHMVQEEIKLDDDHYLVEMGHALYMALLAAKLKVGEIAAIHVLELLGSYNLQEVKIEITRKAETLTVRPVRRN